MQITINIHIDDRIIGFFKRNINKRNAIITIPIIAVISSLAVYAASITKPHTFAPNAVISSSEMNDNFDTLYAKVNALDSLHESAYVYRTTSLSIPDDVDTPVEFDSEEYDETGMHSLVSNPARLTAQSSGLYYVQAHVQFPIHNNVGYRIASLFKNGDFYSGGISIASDKMIPTSTIEVVGNPSSIVRLNQNDYIQVTVRQNSGGSLSIQRDNGHKYSLEFMMVKISD